MTEAFLQGEEGGATQMFREMIREAARTGLLETMKQEVEAIYGPRYRLNPESQWWRASSETSIAYVDGGKAETIRPRVVEPDSREVSLPTYEAASSRQGLFNETIAAISSGGAIRG